ncbi:MAG: polyphosphate polymerase domain-containing protein [Vallitaleaceae bacterium]|nr:polyphosphate polymerase domain-containing protein [Vallitaleaceae bacterium]
MKSEILHTRRKEMKYIVNYGQYLLLSSLLKSVMEPDPHSNEEGYYFVRSLYFDSFKEKDFTEKEEGIAHRRKIRLRYYSLEPELVKLETKEKMNLHTMKKSLSLSREEAQVIFQGDYEGLIESEPRLYDHLKSFSYGPSTLVDYEREAYVSELFQVRINFDMNIRGTRFFEHAFHEETAMVPLIDHGLYILEVKYTGHLPDYLQSVLSQIEVSQVSYSKYYYSRKMSGGYL